MEKCKTLTQAKVSSKEDKMISNDKKVDETFRDFFVIISPNLKSFPKEN